MQPITENEFEKCMYNRLYLYFNKNKLFYDHQFGFIEKISTELAVNQIYEEFINNIE